MDRHVIRDGPASRGGFTWKGLLVVMVVIGVLLALLVQGVLIARESARRICCRNNLKLIGLGLHSYTRANKVFPPGTICATEPIAPGNQYDVWSEAAQTGPGFHGTSFLLCIIPYIEGNGMFWNRTEGISSRKREKRHTYGNFDIASCDVRGFYCPSRREFLRPEDKPMMLSPAWTGGGTDYGGCAGRHAAFTLNTGYNICDASTFYEPNYYPAPFTAEDDTEEKRWGIFGRVNVSATFDEISDGASNTIMTGELQRITDVTPGSKDGWAIGGPATLFTTGAMFRYDGKRLECVSSPAEGKLLNNRFFGSPGSAHSGGANFGLADGSVRFLTDTIDPRIFALLGSMADGAEASIDE
ncbi:MAG: DUF1559 domain-containing protein [Planctomycetes bacterium]|nr:DUF1559 domain-containing protein [Planctomycetota bacterium]MBU4400543.1 DUF1559 domain-containing protein [Planctomycetota bacterium]MCG2685020.1 DUF1559 domain-containing protein [Planctomycetales bacterium]